MKIIKANKNLKIMKVSIILIIIRKINNKLILTKVFWVLIKVKLII
jgi:hypothetical protein